MMGDIYPMARPVEPDPVTSSSNLVVAPVILLDVAGHGRNSSRVLPHSGKRRSP